MLWLHIVGDAELGSVLICPDVDVTGDDYDSELILGEDDSGLYAMKLVYNGGSNKLHIFGKSLSTIYGPHITITRNEGNVGINTTSPARTLHVNQYMRLEPVSAPPDNPSPGDIYFDSDDNKLKCYDGSGWQNCF
jgi:hypothetical protein